MNTAIDKRFAIAVRAAAVLTVAGIFVYVMSAAVAPEGFLQTTTHLSNPVPFISEPKPGNRLELSEDGQMYRLLGDPLYLDLTPPGSYESVTVSVTYENHGQSLLEIGALANRLDGQFDMIPAESRLLDTLPWSRVSSGDLVLMQKTKQYSSVEEFLASPPDTARVATYRVGVEWPHVPESWSVREGMVERDVSLRGRHRILTYSGGEPLAFSFVVQDMNRQKGADPVTVSVYRGGEKVDALARTVLVDDGNTIDDQVSSGLRTVSVSVPDAEPGIYRVEFTAPGDIFIRKTMFRQSKAVFVGSLYLGDHVGFSDRTDPAHVVVSGSSLVARTAHIEGLQELTVGDSTMELVEPHAKHYVWLDSFRATAPVVSPKRDVLLETDGVFALHSDDLFSPLPAEIDWHTTADDLNRAGIDFLLADYETPETDGVKTVATATFDVANLATTEDGAYRFALSAPGIGYTQKDLRIESVSFTLRRPPTGWAEGLKRFVAGLGGQSRDTETAAILVDGKSYGERVE